MAKELPKRTHGMHRVTLDQIADLALPNPKSIRAITYQEVARGTCPRCRKDVLPLRFCYNPYGDDDLICMGCAGQQDEFFNQHSENNR